MKVVKKVKQIIELYEGDIIKFDHSDGHSYCIGYIVKKLHGFGYEVRPRDFFKGYGAKKLKDCLGNVKVIGSMNNKEDVAKWIAK